MQIVEVDKDKLLSIIQAEILRLDTQHEYNDTFWKLLLLETALKDLYRRTRLWETNRSRKTTH